MTGSMIRKDTILRLTLLLCAAVEKNLVKMLQHKDNSLKRPARRKTVPNLSLPISKTSLDNETNTICGDHDTIFQ